jgi:3-phosphoshikimate 1-carboxyvinyltransferase
VLLLQSVLEKKILSIANNFSADISLPASKSESNRALILNALSGFNCTICNLSEANDTQVLQNLLISKSEIRNAEDAGTVMRFLLAYLAIKGEKCTLTGTERMQQRPIAILVDALKTLGADIKYLKNEGFPPLAIGDFNFNKVNEVKIKANVSSQYISALLLVASQLPNGLKLHLEGDISSKPYIQMTLGTMAQFGINHIWDANLIEIKKQEIKKSTFHVENDWSAVGYWCSMVALAEEGKIKLSGLKKDSLQGDSQILGIYSKLGVYSYWEGENLVLESEKDKIATQLTLDFTDIPDQAQTVMVTVAVLKIPTVFYGLESLKIKETNRIEAMDTELRKFGSGLECISDNKYSVLPISNLTKNTEINTYKDHRMAMSFAPLAIKVPIVIENPDCVKKSFPNFWNEVEKLGYKKTTQLT